MDPMTFPIGGRVVQKISSHIHLSMRDKLTLSRVGTFYDGEWDYELHTLERFFMLDLLFVVPRIGP